MSRVTASELPAVNLWQYTELWRFREVQDLTHSVSICISHSLVRDIYYVNKVSTHLAVVVFTCQISIFHNICWLDAANEGCRIQIPVFRVLNNIKFNIYLIFLYYHCCAVQLLQCALYMYRKKHFRLKKEYILSKTSKFARLLPAENVAVERGGVFVFSKQLDWISRVKVTSHL